MYWVQEHGQLAGNARSDYKMYYCDYTTDVSKLPTQTKKGTQNTGNETLNDLYNAFCKPGDQCMCLESSKVYTLGWQTNAWKEM